MPLLWNGQKMVSEPDVIVNNVNKFDKPTLNLPAYLQPDNVAAALGTFKPRNQSNSSFLDYTLPED